MAKCCGAQQLEMVGVLRAVLTSRKKDLSRVWWVFSGLGKLPQYAKIMSYIDGQETLGQNGVYFKIKVRCTCQVTRKMAFNRSRSHQRFLCTSTGHSSTFFKCKSRYHLHVCGVLLEMESKAIYKVDKLSSTKLHCNPKLSPLFCFSVLNSHLGSKFSFPTSRVLTCRRNYCC